MIVKYNFPDDLHDVVVASGSIFNSADIANFDPRTFATCGQHDGSVVGGISLYFHCVRPMVARFVTLYMDVENDALNICEVEVYSQQGRTYQIGLFLTSSLFCLDTIIIYLILILPTLNMECESMDNLLLTRVALHFFHEVMHIICVY